MMQPICFLLIALAIFAMGSVLSLLFHGNDRIAIFLSGIAGLAGSLMSAADSLYMIFTGGLDTLVFTGPFAFAFLSIRFDLFSAFMVLLVSVLTCVVSLYSFSYVREYEHQGAWSIGFFSNLFVASMIALSVVDNAFYFLVFFELMSLTSYFLVLFNRDGESISAAFLYFLIAHGGSILIMGSFFIFWMETGSLEFEVFRQCSLNLPLASLAFLLAFFGFGAKAGIVPLHSWLPRAHPAAPSHISALMSGVMVKIGIFGIIRVAVEFLHATAIWWGIIVLAFGAVSAVLGVLYALAEQDIKRLLAYSTVENVGIILMGVGAGMMGMAANLPVLTAVGFLGAIYHMLNHTLFKGLLFMGTGAIIFRTHTRNMDVLN